MSQESYPLASLHTVPCCWQKSQKATTIYGLGWLRGAISCCATGQLCTSASHDELNRLRLSNSVINSWCRNRNQQVPALPCQCSGHCYSPQTPPEASVISLQMRFLKTPITALHGWTCWLPLLHWQTVHSSSVRCSIGKKLSFFPLDCCCFLLLLLLLCLTVTEITAGGAVLLHQPPLAVAITFPSPGWTDK